MRNRYRDNLTLALIGCLYIFAVIKATLYPMHVPVTGWQMLLFAVLAFLFYTFVNTYAGRIVFFTAAASGVVYILFLLIKHGVSGLNVITAPAVKLANVIVQAGTGYYNDSISDFWLMCALGAFSLVVALPVYYFLVRYNKYYFLIVPGIVFFMVVWGIIRHVDKMSFYIFITIAIVLFIRHRYLEQGEKMAESYQRESPSGLNLIVYFLPVALVIILISSFVPVSDMPIQWEWMDKKISRLWQDIDTRLSVDRYDKFSLAKTGFGDSSRLGGPVSPDDTLIMVVKAPSRVYLRGAVYDVYTGFGWELSETDNLDSVNDTEEDYLELQHGWETLMLPEFSNFIISRRLIPYGDIINLYIEFSDKKMMQGLLEKLYPENQLEIQYRQIRTKTLFTPLKLITPITGIPSHNIVQESPGGIFYTSKKLGNDEKYYLNYLQPAYGMKELAEILSYSWAGVYGNFNENIDYLVGDNILISKEVKQKFIESADVIKLLEERRNNIYEKYTQLPDSITDRVFSITRIITSNHISDYEKVKAIEKYLNVNFNYTLSPVIPPEEQDFVDFFLFDGKEGYCSYYASAMCIMARIAGIPARYVEGFVLPEKSNDDGYYYVTNKNAHAWVEVYFEGIGWVTFEPTAPMAGAMNYYVDLSEKTTEYGQNNNMPEIYEPDEELEEDRGNLNFGTGIQDEKNSIVLIIIIALIAAVLLLWFINIIFMFARFLVHKILPEKKRAIILYRYAISLVKQAGRGINNGETPLDFAARIDELYGFNNTNMKDMVNVYYSVRFGNNIPDKKSLDSLFVFVRELKRETGSNMYLLKRIIYRCLLFKG